MTSLPLASTAPRASYVPLRSALQLLEDPYQWWPKQYAKYGPVFRVKLPTDLRPWIVMVGREANEFVAREGARLFTQKKTYARGAKILKTDHHPSFTDGSVQRHMRRQVAPGFSRQAADPHLPAMMKWAREYVDRWEVGQSINVSEELTRIGLNIISIFATGEDLGARETERIRRFATTFTGVLAMGWPIFLLNSGETGRTRIELDDMIRERLEHHRQHPPNHDRFPDYFDFLLRGTMPEGGPLSDRVSIVFGQIPFKNMGVYAGRVINHMLFNLVRHPEALALVQPEIDQVFADDELTLEEVASMDAMNATMKETLRLLPTGVTLQRTVAEPFEFGGYRFEPDDKVFTAISATHFLPEFFPDPQVFDIQRFMAHGEHLHLPRYAYNPFGLGQHLCVAQGVFEFFAIVTIGTILHRWKLDAPYELRTILDALPGPDPSHEMRILERREAAPPRGKRRRSPTQRYALSAFLLDALDGAPEISVPAGQLLFAQGDEADRLYFILDGQLRVFASPEEGHEIELATLGPGEVVGEIAVLHGLTRTASVAALANTTLLAVDGETFLDAVVESNITARELGELAVRRHAGALIAQVFENSRRMPTLGRRGQVYEIELEPGTTLFRQGEPADQFYLLASGSLELLAEGLAGEPRVLQQITAPDCIGDVGLIDGRPRPNTARAGKHGAKLLSLDRDAFVDVSQGDEAQAAVSLVAKIRFKDTLDGDLGDEEL